MPLLLDLSGPKVFLVQAAALGTTPKHQFLGRARRTTMFIMSVYTMFGSTKALYSEVAASDSSLISRCGSPTGPTTPRGRRTRNPSTRRLPSGRACMRVRLCLIMSSLLAERYNQQSCTRLVHVHIKCVYTTCRTRMYVMSLSVAVAAGKRAGWCLSALNRVQQGPTHHPALPSV